MALVQARVGFIQDHEGCQGILHAADEAREYKEHAKSANVPRSSEEIFCDFMACSPCLAPSERLLSDVPQPELAPGINDVSGSCITFPTLNIM